MDNDLRVEKEVLLPAAQLKGHIAELLRVGIGERYKNNKSKGDFAIFPEDEPNKGKIYFLNKDPNDLKMLARTLNDKIQNYEDFNLYGRKLLIQNINKDSELFSNDDVMFGRMLFEAMVVAEGIIPLCVVGHQDQDDMYLHWHLIYMNKTQEDFGQLLLHGKNSN